MNLIDAWVVEITKISYGYGRYWTHVKYETEYTDEIKETTIMNCTRKDAENIKVGHKFLT